MTETTPTLTPDDEGMWFIGSASRTADELNAAVILAALHYGWTPNDAAAVRTLAEGVDGWLDADAAEILTDAANDADSYLNGIAPEGYVLGFDDGYGMWRVDEDGEPIYED